MPVYYFTAMDTEDDLDSAMLSISPSKFTLGKLIKNNTCDAFPGTAKW